ncbi:MAG: DUF4349 domain-containing protein, partial [Rubrobacter sp.]|nr:DUF4349 domain-containing protein [Rubrobacter sp.]
MSRIRIWFGMRSLRAIAAVQLALALTARSRGGEGEQGDGGVAVKDRMESVARPESGAGYAGDAVAGEGVSGEVVGQEDFDRKIVKTADLGMTSEDVRGGAASAQQLASRLGGTIVSAQTYRADNAVYADLVISVPSEEFENALDELR